VFYSWLARASFFFHVIALLCRRGKRPIKKHTCPLLQARLRPSNASSPPLPLMRLQAWHDTGRDDIATWLTCQGIISFCCCCAGYCRAQTGAGVEAPGIDGWHGCSGRNTSNSSSRTGRGPGPRKAAVAAAAGAGVIVSKQAWPLPGSWLQSRRGCGCVCRPPHLGTALMMQAA
jgi:hypothetical protein